MTTSNSIQTCYMVIQTIYLTFFICQFIETLLKKQKDQTLKLQNQQFAKYQNSQNDKVIFDDNKKKKFILTHLDHYFKEMRLFNFQKNKINQIDFYYINFLIYQCKAKSNALYQIEQIKQQISSQSISYQIYLNYVIQKIDEEFQDLHERTKSCSIGLIFEETLKKASGLFESCILIKLKLMSLLNSDNIDINIFQKFGIELFNKRTQLRKFLQDLSIINNQNYLLKDIITGYLDLLSFIETKEQIINKKLYLKQQRHNTLLLKKRQRYGEQINHNYSISEDVEIDNEQINSNSVFNPFDRNVCTIFMKLKNSDLGKIWRVQDSFIKIFGFKNPIGQNINLIIPSSLHNIHNNVIKNFVGTVNPLGMKFQKINLSIGNTIEGFGIPIQLEVSIDHVTHFNEIGIIAMTKTIESESHFILLENKSKQIKTNLVTKTFYSNYISQVYTIQEASSLNFIKIIPILNYSLSENLQSNKTIQSIAILPINSEDGQASKNYFKHQSNFSKKSNEFDLEHLTNNPCVSTYMIDFQIHKFQNKDFNSMILEITKIQRLKKQKDINYELYMLQSKIEELQNNTGKKLKYIKYVHELILYNFIVILHFYLKNIENIEIEAKPPKINEIISLIEYFIFQLKISQFLIQYDNFQSNMIIFKANNKYYRLYPNFLQDFQTKKIRKQYVSKVYQMDLILNINKINNQKQLFNQIKNLFWYLKNIHNSSQIINKFIYFQNINTPNNLSENFLGVSNFLKVTIYNNSCQSNDQEDKANLVIIKTQQLANKFYKTQQENNGLEATDNKKQMLLFGNKIEEQDGLEDEGIYESSQILYKENRIKRNTQEMVFPTRKRESSLGQSSLFAKKQNQDIFINNIKKQLLNQVDNSYSYQFKSDGQLISKHPSQQQIEEMIPYEERRSSYIQVNSMEDKVLGQDNIYKSKEQDKGSSMRSSSNIEKSMNKKSTRIRAQQSSIQSSHSSTKEALKTVERKIMSLQNSLGLQILNLVGTFSVVVIVIMIIVIFIDILIAFKKASIDFYFIQWPMEVSFSTAFLQYINVLIKMNQYNVFPKLTQQWTNCLAENYGLIERFKDRLDGLLIDQITSDYDYAPYFKQLTTTNNTWIDLREYNTFPNYVNRYTTLNSYFLQAQLNAYKTIQMFQSDYMNQEAVIIENYDSYISLNDKLQEAILESSLNSLDSIFDKVLILMILSITLTFCVIIFIFPIYAYIQSQREEVLKLFSTIPSSGIMRMANPGIMILQQLNSQSRQKQQSKKSIKQTENSSKQQNQATFSTKLNSINTNKDTTESITQVGREIIIKSLETSQKKKNISRTTLLPRFSLPLFIVSFALFLIIITIPIVNAVLIKKFRDESVLNIDLINSLFNLKEAFSETIFFTYYHIYGKFKLKEGAVYKPELITERYVEMESSNNIYISEQIDRYGNSEYVSFFYPVLESDICQHLKEHPKYTENQSFTIDYDICDKPKYSILKKGLQTTIKQYFNQLYESFDISNSYTDQNYAEEMQDWQSDFDIQNFNEFFAMIVKVITILKDFMDMQGQNYIDEMKITEIILTCSQILILLIVFYFGWISFYYSTSFQMNQTRRLLSLIDISVIVDNSYIMSYLNKIK